MHGQRNIKRVMKVQYFIPMLTSHVTNMFILSSQIL